MKPLLDAGRVQLYTPEMPSCLNCFESVFGSDTKRKIEKGYNALTKDYFDNSTVSLIEYNRNVCKFQLDGPEPFFKHPMVMVYPARGRIRDVIDDKPKLIKRLKESDAVTLPVSLARKLLLQRKFSGIVANSATFGILSSEMLKTSFLTDNPLDISFSQDHLP